MERLKEEYGPEVEVASEHFTGNLYVLTFQENRRGGDPVAHTPDGKAVFPDKFRGGTDIIVGDTWLCDVTSKGGSTFFAAPLKRIDSAFFFDLAADQIERIVEIGLDEHHHALRPLLEAAVEKRADQATKGRLGALEEEKRVLEERLKDLEEQYDDTVQRVRHYEVEVRALREQVTANGDGGMRSEAAAEPDGAPSGWNGLQGPAAIETGPVSVERIESEILTSQAFVAERYYGHMSPDRKRLFIKAHANGNLPCVNGRLHIPGLGRVVPFGGRATYSGQYDPRHGGWFVRL